MKSKLLIISILFMFCVDACTNDTRKELACSSLVNSSYKNINSALALTTPGDINTFKFSDPTFLIVDNKSSSIIEIAPGTNIKTYLWMDDQWQVVVNQVDYLSAIDMIYPKTNTDPGGTIYSIILNLPSNLESAKVCVVLDGVIDPKASSSEVAAYTEFTLYQP